MRNDAPTMRIRRLWAAMPGLAASRPRPGYAGGEETSIPPDGLLRAHLRQVPGGSDRAGERHAERHGHVVPAGPGVGIQADLYPDGDHQTASRSRPGRMRAAPGG